MKRQEFIKTLALTPLLRTIKAGTNEIELPQWQFKPLNKQFERPIRIKDIQLRHFEGELLLIVFEEAGRLGITQCNARMQHLTSILNGLILPHFIGKDARELPQLVDNAYRLNSNYKYAGMPLWNCIGTVEIAVWDLLGKIKQRPVHELLGKKLRSSYPVYISDFNRSGDITQIIETLKEKLAATSANGVKIKIGGRMQNTATSDAFMRKFVPQVRKRLGDTITIYADGNGSFNVKEGIVAGKLLEENRVEIFEEPCSFENEDGMREINEALTKLKLAGGEQDSSTYRFERLARTNVYDIFQPDVYYNGGILKTLQVSEIARLHGKYFAPHSPKIDPLIGPYWQVAALCKNLYGLQECVYNLNEKKPGWYTPEVKINDGKVEISSFPGLGIQYDEKAILAKKTHN